MENDIVVLRSATSPLSSPLSATFATVPLPLIAANSVCLLLSAFILLMKLLPRREKAAIADAVTPGST